MVSERIQRRIDQLLNEADEAVTSDDWKTVQQRANAALAFEPESADASAYLEAAEAEARSCPDTSNGRQS